MDSERQSSCEFSLLCMERYYDNVIDDNNHVEINENNHTVIDEYNHVVIDEVITYSEFMYFRACPKFDSYVKQ